MKHLLELIESINALSLDEKVNAINEVKKSLHDISPFKNEPVDCVLWVKNQSVFSNDYNPNSVAPPEMELLRLSIEADGYTQPIVTMNSGDGDREVIDGFHRNRVGKECQDIQQRVQGYLPVVTINQSREDKGDRIASTIRHNRARGKHKVTAMSDIVVDLKKRNWSDDKIARELGMDADEVLRLCQISGLSEMFSDQEFSQAWEIDMISEVDNLEDIEE
jgi:ParB-like chromosome segregation protein Spo0J